MLTAEKRKLPLTGDRLIAYSAIVVLVAAVVYLYVQNTALHPNTDKLLQADPPIMVGDGSIIFDYPGAHISNNGQDLGVMKFKKVTKLTATSGASVQTFTLKSGWTLTSNATPAFSFAHGGIGSGEGYIVTCPPPATWTHTTGSEYECGTTTQLTPATLSPNGGTCSTPQTPAGTCKVGDVATTKWRLKFE